MNKKDVEHRNYINEFLPTYSRLYCSRVSSGEQPCVFVCVEGAHQTSDTFVKKREREHMGSNDLARKTPDDKWFWNPLRIA